jgi:hypothetical protein
MKLSDLVALAQGSDPEITVYEEDGEHWRLFPARGRLVGGRVILFSEPGADEAIAHAEDSASPNPLAPLRGACLREDMENTIIAEDSEHAAFLHADQTVNVYRKTPTGLDLIGMGHWENGTILGSGVNCGILVRLEPSLREQSGTP